MCNWFSCISDGKGNMFYFNAKQRKAIKENKLFDGTQGNNIVKQPDSHSSLSTFYKLDDDKCNKYEFRPLDRFFIVDQIDINDDQKIIKKKLSR